jgi:hypothetical protein
MRLWVDLRFLLRQPNVGTFEALYVRPFRISHSRQSKHKTGLASAIGGMRATAFFSLESKANGYPPLNLTHPTCGAMTPPAVVRKKIVDICCGFGCL